jgi:hypothetical protein
MGLIGAGIFAGFLKGSLGHAEGETRALTCRFSLPDNESRNVSVPLQNGRAEFAFEYTYDTDSEDIRTFSIRAEVWGFQSQSQRTSGFLMVRQIAGASVQKYRTYAINHCELKNFTERCDLGLVIVMSGVGIHANCAVPEAP